MGLKDLLDFWNDANQKMPDRMERIRETPVEELQKELDEQIKQTTEELLKERSTSETRGT